jgi:hypothetical protein
MESKPTRPREVLTHVATANAVETADLDSWFQSRTPDNGKRAAGNRGAALKLVRDFLHLALACFDISDPFTAGLRRSMRSSLRSSSSWPTAR